MRIVLLCLTALWSLGWSLEIPEGAFNENGGRNWVILIAGSEGWGNYRHQSDIFHAYHIVRSRGIPASQIITFAYDDIANNPQNPFPGQVFNTYEHKDVYAGVVIDYKGLNINPKVVERVMLGDAQLSEKGYKVLKSGPNDHIFLYYSDHGNEGFISLPNGVMYAKHLNQIFRVMYQKKMYKQMVVYIEACYSGSMFEMAPLTGLPVYATTAANSQESSRGFYCSDPVIRTCLTDEYSQAWMVDTETHDINKHTLHEQFTNVRSKVRGSHVSRYGDVKISTKPIAQFQANGLFKEELISEKNTHDEKDGVHATSAHLHSLMRTVMEVNDKDLVRITQRKLHRALELAKFVDSIFEDLLADVEKRHKPALTSVNLESQMECFEKVFDVFQAHCFTIQQVPEIGNHVNKLHKMCTGGYDPEHLIQSVLHICT